MTTQTPAIGFDGLSKRYGSGALAVDDLTLEIPRGEIFGFLGPNGAGKTTTIRLMLDLIRPTSGSAHILGMNCNDGDPAVRDGVGYLPGDLSLYPNMTGQAIVDLFASMRPGRVDDGWVRELRDRLDIDLDRKTRELSHGNKQKVGIVLALMARADVVILDEPTAGLDPLAQQAVLDILHRMREDGSTVFFSSHNLHEVEHVCDRVGMIRRGRLIAVERVADLTRKRRSFIDVTFGQAPPSSAFDNVAGVTVQTRDEAGVAWRIEIQGEIDPLVKALAEHHVGSLESVQPSLEEEFIALYRTVADNEAQA